MFRVDYRIGNNPWQELGTLDEEELAKSTMLNWSVQMAPFPLTGPFFIDMRITRIH